jgi:hypothetical protein
MEAVSFTPQAFYTRKKKSLPISLDIILSRPQN